MIRVFNLISSLIFGSVLIFLSPVIVGSAAADDDAAAGDPGHVAVLDMETMILPGTQSHLEKSIEVAAESGAKLLIIRLNTPGGMLHTSQKMIQAIFQSPVPIVVYVSPTGGSATSAGVFITMAAHVAVMAPGTSIGAAHPVLGDGSDIQGDMRKKAEEMTMAMVRSITEERGRNVEWAELAVKESSSLTEREALEKDVVDLIARDLTELLEGIAGKVVQTSKGEIELSDYSDLPRVNYEMSLSDEVINILANPNVVALLWLAATTGISLELYNPGMIVPGVVGVICLILALAVSQIIPISQGSLLLMIVGSILLVAEFFTGTVILGVGGVIAIVIGALYLIDVSQAPGLEVSPEIVLPFAILMGVLLLITSRAAVKASKQPLLTGREGLVGKTGRAIENISSRGKVYVDGGYWDAEISEGIIEKGDTVRVEAVLDGMVLRVSAVQNKVNQE